jgi:hypothetical protein
MTAQAGGSIGGGQRFVRNLGMLFGDPEKIRATRTAQATERGQRLLERNAQAARNALVPNAAAEAAATNILRPVQLAQAEDVLGLQARGARTAADIQSGLEADRTSNVQRVINTGIEGKQGLNQGIFDHTERLVNQAQAGDMAMQRAFFGETPFSQQLFGHVAGESAANRALELEKARRNTAPWQVGAALKGIGLAGLFLS